MKVGDLVMFESDVPESQRFWTGRHGPVGLVIGEAPSPMGPSEWWIVEWAGPDGRETISSEHLKLVS
jgi:hypothetical protein